MPPGDKGLPYQGEVVKSSMQRFYEMTQEACEHFRFARCTNGVFFAIDLVHGKAYRRDSEPEYLICKYDQIAIHFRGVGIMAPEEKP